MNSIFKKIHKKIFSKKETLNIQDIEKYREFDAYTLDIEVHCGQNVFVSSKLPSEPPQGITYKFGPSGYVGCPSSNYCVIPVAWRNTNNYCHWNFSELPFLFLAFESNVKNLVFPDIIIESKLPFQKRWLDLLTTLYPDKNINSISKTIFPEKALIPINHDTSNCTEPIGKCEYRHYHHGRATPYLIDRIDTTYKNYFMSSTKIIKTPQLIYINRSNRRLKNESELQKMLQEIGFEIVNLEELILDEQVLFFSNAKIIIGFHGAGLSNLLFASNSTKVFEIVDQDCVYPCYKDGVVVPGKKATRTYFHMLCEMKEIAYESIESKKYILDINNFKNKLTKILSTS